MDVNQISFKRVNFKLDIPFGQENLKSLDYSLDVEIFGGENEAETSRADWLGNLNRLQRNGFDRNLLPYERWDIIFRGTYKKEEGLEKLALDLLKDDGWYGVDMVTKVDKETRQREHVFRMPKGQLCSFNAIFTEGYGISFGKLARENPDLFRFIYGRDVEEIREATAQHTKTINGILAYGGPFSEFLGGIRTMFYSGLSNEWLHGVHDSLNDLFHIGDDNRYISRGVRYVKNEK